MLSRIYTLEESFHGLCVVIVIVMIAMTILLRYVQKTNKYHELFDINPLHCDDKIEIVSQFNIGDDLLLRIIKDKATGLGLLIISGKDKIFYIGIFPRQELN